MSAAAAAAGGSPRPIPLAVSAGDRAIGFVSNCDEQLNDIITKGRRFGGNLSLGLIRLICELNTDSPSPDSESSIDTEKKRMKLIRAMFLATVATSILAHKPEEKVLLLSTIIAAKLFGEVMWETLKSTVPGWIDAVSGLHDWGAEIMSNVRGTLDSFVADPQAAEVAAMEAKVQREKIEAIESKRKDMNERMYQVIINISVMITEFTRQEIIITDPTALCKHLLENMLKEANIRAIASHPDVGDFDFLREMYADNMGNLRRDIVSCIWETLIVACHGDDTSLEAQTSIQLEMGEPLGPEEWIVWWEDTHLPRDDGEKNLFCTEIITYFLQVLAGCRRKYMKLENALVTSSGLSAADAIIFLSLNQLLLPNPQKTQGKMLQEKELIKSMDDIGKIADEMDELINSIVIPTQGGGSRTRMKRKKKSRKHRRANTRKKSKSKTKRKAKSIKKKKHKTKRHKRYSK